MADIDDYPGGRYLLRWQERFHDDGSLRGRPAHRKRVFNQRREAEALKRRIEDAAAARKPFLELNQPARRREPASLEEPMKAFLVYVAERKSPRTARNTGVALELFSQFCGGLNTVKLSDLTVSRLDAFYRWCLDTPGRHKRTRKLDTVAKYVERVQSWWKWIANQDAWADLVPKPRTLADLPRDPKMPTRAAKWDEMDAAIAHVDIPGDGRFRRWSALPMAVMRALGLRVMQTLRLKVGDVVFTDGVLELHFRGELGKSRQERAGRIVPIAPAMAPLFNLLTEGRSADEWLIPARREGGERARELRPESVREAWKRSGVREEIWKGRPDHAFRKGFNSGLRAAGAERDAVEFLIGHSLGTVTDAYTDGDFLGLKPAVALMPAFSTAAWAVIQQAFKESSASHGAVAGSTDLSAPGRAASETESK